MTLAVGVDIGGTKVAAGVVDETGTVLTRAVRPTPSRSPEALVELVHAVVSELRAPHPDVVAVGVGAAGFIDVERSTVLFAPNLAWRDEPLCERLVARLDLPVVIENDANAAAWAEYRYGAGECQPDLVMLTIGTGIGGGIVLDGRLHRGRFGIAGEPGHMQVVPGGRLCGCGNHGCWEQYCSGTALVRLAREALLERPESAPRLTELAGGDPSAVDGPMVTRAAKDGDPQAIACFTDIGRWLGVGMCDLAAVLDPGRFVVGGGVVDAGDLLLAPARQAFAEGLTGRGYRPLADVVPARLGPDAGMIGAADLARQD